MKWKLIKISRLRIFISMIFMESRIRKIAVCLQNQNGLVESILVLLMEKEGFLLLPSGSAKLNESQMLESLLGIRLGPYLKRFLLIQKNLKIMLILMWPLKKMKFAILEKMQFLPAIFSVDISQRILCMKLRLNVSQEIALSHRMSMALWWNTMRGIITEQLWEKAMESFRMVVC